MYFTKRYHVYQTFIVYKNGMIHVVVNRHGLLRIYILAYNGPMPVGFREWPLFVVVY